MRLSGEPSAKNVGATRRSVRSVYWMFCDLGTEFGALTICCAMATALTACEKQNAYVPPPPPKVTVVQPLQRPVIHYIELTGNTAASKKVDLEARIQGFLEEIGYVDGSPAKKGALLFSIQRNSYEAQLAQAGAALAANQAAQANAQAQYARQKTLGAKHYAAEAKVEDARTRLDEVIASVKGAVANVEIAKINLGYTKITAPFDGIVTRHLVDVGALVGYGGPTKLATIVQVDPICVYFSVSEAIVLRIKEDLARRNRPLGDIHEVPVEIGLQTEEGFPHAGNLDYVSPEVDPSTGTLEVRAILDNKDFALLPGLFVRVRIPAQRIADALLVPDTAVATNQLGQYLLVVTNDNSVEQRQVKIGQLEGQLREIESGIRADEWVVTEGIQRAIPGSKVEADHRKIVVSAVGG